ncbi:hypothetical protein V1517DRAFT_308168 [Lipomyces orientalis]|uniref:Uncharacterized protein n=1 Tax=Lipomyces orientalis TaxID=1233043 RepID=A0ACC3TM74_9ASCO
MKKCRDNSRLRLQWDNSDYAGFSAVQRWMNVMEGDKGNLRTSSDTVTEDFLTTSPLPTHSLSGTDKSEPGVRNILRRSGAPISLQSHMPEGGWIKKDLFNWTDEELQWFKDRGCEWVKPSMELGDFVSGIRGLSTTALSPSQTSARLFTDTCYKPIDFLTEEQRERKVEAFKRGYMTSHDPTDVVLKEEPMADWNILHPTKRLSRLSE